MNLILVGLYLLIAVEVLQLINSARTYSGNHRAALDSNKTLQTNVDTLRFQWDHERRLREAAQADIRRLKLVKNFTAFAIYEDGIMVLPEGWKAKIEELYQPKDGSPA